MDSRRPQAVSGTLVIEVGKRSGDQLRAAAEIAGPILRELCPEETKAEAAARLSVRMAWLTGSVGAVALAGLAGLCLPVSDTDERRGVIGKDCHRHFPLSFFRAFPRAFKRATYRGKTC
jgi:hypothetical protein